MVVTVRSVELMAVLLVLLLALNEERATPAVPSSSCFFEEQ
jgi:hypothetical protein